MKYKYRKIENRAYKYLFNEIRKNRYSTLTIEDCYINKMHDPNKVNIALRFDVDFGALPAYWTSQYLKKINIHASFYFLTRTAPYPLNWDLLREMSQNGFEIGLHSDHYLEELKSGMNGLDLIRNDAHKFEQELCRKVGMVWHGNAQITYYRHGNWELYREIKHEDLRLAYHDGRYGKYCSLDSDFDNPTGWKPPKGIWLSDHPDRMSTHWKGYLKLLRKAKPGTLFHIMFHPHYAFKWWKLNIREEEFPSKYSMLFKIERRFNIIKNEKMKKIVKRVIKYERSKIILQYGNVAGLPYNYSLVLKKMNIDSTHVIPEYRDLSNFKRQLPFDKAICNHNVSKFLKCVKIINYFSGMILNTRLIHFHGVSNILNPRINLEHHIFKILKIPTIISFAGEDARIVRLARQRNPYFYRELDDKRDKLIQNRLKQISQYIHYVATDYEMAEYVRPYFEKVFILRQPVDLERITCKIPKEEEKNPLIVHISTKPWVKGTAYIESAINRLKLEGYYFRFKLLQFLSQGEVLDEILKADIYVDDLRCGSYGITSVEAMASGKPTVCYIRDDLVEKYPKDLPLVNANPDTIYQKLKELILDSELRHEIGIKSRTYAEKYHSLEVIGPRLLNIYKEIGLKI
jgi:glycosyltransferase involved in cell wall biosynthesis